MTRKISSGVAAGISVVAIAAAGFAPAIAMAADNGTTSATDVSSITADTGNLHVTKLTPSSQAQSHGDGTKLTSTPAGSKAIEGVKFTAKKVTGIDLKTNKGWKDAAKIIDAANGYKPDNETNPTKVTKAGATPAEYALEAVPQGAEQATNADGKVTFTGLPVGLYLVTEKVDAPVNIANGEKNVPAERVNKAKPFYVTIPMTNPEKTGWMYDIYAYPKNSLSTVPTKTVDDDKEGIGSGNDNSAASKKSTITYTLSAVVPSVPEIKKFDLVDKFPTDKLAWIDNGALDVVKVGTTVLQKTTDYNFSTIQQKDGYSYLAVEITPAGLEKLAAKHQGETLSWTFHAKVLKQGTATRIPNTPFLNENPNGWTTTEPGQPGPSVESHYGRVILNKKNEANQPLAGAEFALYECSKDGFTDPLNNKTVAAKWVLEEKNRVSVDGVNSWTSGDNGKLEIGGLLVNDFRNNSEFIDPAADQKVNWSARSWYCLKEIKAPAGYELLPNPIKFQITRGAAEATPGDITLEVHNNKTPELPVTGGAGIAVLVAGGVLLLAGSGIYAFAANRKRKLQ